MSYAEDQSLANRLAPFIIAKIRQTARVISSTPISPTSDTQIFQAVLSQDGPGSELNADTVDGYHASMLLDHGTHTGLADDDHEQYALLAGRSGGQTLVGGTGAGNSLRLRSTSHATKGDVIVSDPLLLETATASRLVATDANKRLVTVLLNDLGADAWHAHLNVLTDTRIVPEDHTLVLDSLDLSTDASIELLVGGTLHLIG